jgi:DNA polymerase-3 subunit delta'
MTAFAPWQQRLLQRLLESHRAGRLPHALLLSGPEKLGKRALAECLMQTLLCGVPREEGPCGECASCRLFQNRFQRDPVETRPDESPAHPDGHPGHPDARFVGFVLNEKSSPKKMYSELVIEQIRELSAWLTLSPTHGAKAALIEPAHLLTTAAANALLKTLEEPIPGRYLILVTDHPHRLPATIRSRCQRVDLRVPPRAEALAWLLEGGAQAAAADEALDANEGHPGLARRDLDEGGLTLRAEVAKDLAALAAGRERAALAATRWIEDRLGLRLRFAVEAVREWLAARAAGAAAGRLAAAGLPAQVDAGALAAWADAANRTHDWLRSTLRQDLMIGELLRQWRQACAKIAPRERIAGG